MIKNLVVLVVVSLLAIVVILFEVATVLHGDAPMLVIGACVSFLIAQGAQEMQHNRNTRDRIVAWQNRNTVD